MPSTTIAADERTFTFLKDLSSINVQQTGPNAEKSVAPSGAAAEESLPFLETEHKAAGVLPTLPSFAASRSPSAPITPSALLKSHPSRSAFVPSFAGVLVREFSKPGTKGFKLSSFQLLLSPLRDLFSYISMTISHL